MKISILVNDLNVKMTQSTALIKKTVESLGHQAEYLSVHDFNAEQMRKSCDLFWIRTNPGRDHQNLHIHKFVLNELHKLSTLIPVVNNPFSLLKIMSKEYLLELPHQVVPLTRLIFSPEELKKSISEIPDSIIKPIIGTKGEGIVKTKDIQNLKQLSYPLIFQEFIYLKHPNDKRIFLVNGEPLQIDGQYCVVQRNAKKGEFRSNVAQGGTPGPTNLNEKELTSLFALKKWVKDNNLYLLGVDMVDDKVIEINSFSPGGLGDIDRYYQKDFSGTIIKSILDLAF